MDIKSMAKSKRSHTQHHQPRKAHNPPQNPSSSSSTSATKKDGSKDKKKATQPKPPSLPSNWDRYEDEDEVQQIPIYSDTDNTAQFAGSNAKLGVDSNEVKPKSKGADFRDLIAQAKESRTYYSPSFDDKLPENYQGVAPMLAARGGKLIVQDKDDDYLMDDDAGDAQEAPFLTLDLEDLARQLSKIDLAERLFIEPDLLPQELHGQYATEDGDQKHLRTPERQKFQRADSFDDLLALYLEEERMAKSQDDVDQHGLMSSNISSYHESKIDMDITKSMTNLGFVDAKAAVQFSHAGEKDANSKLDDQVETTKPATKSNLEDLGFLNKSEMTQNVTEQDTTSSSRFEAAAVEAELDLLLGSFTETKLFDIPANEPGTSATIGAVQHSLSRPVPAFPITTSLDDELDDLLAVSSNPNNKDELSLPQSFQVPSSQPSSKSKVLEDFDSWLDTI